MCCISVTLAVFVLVLPRTYARNERLVGLRHGKTEAQLESKTLPEDSAFWDRLLQDSMGSMDFDEVPGMVIVPSIYSFEDTLSNLDEALDMAPVSVVAEIDHSGAAASAGLDLDPNRLVVFGNPNLGTPIMQENREAGIDLPQKMLVWEKAEGTVFVGYNSVEYLKFRYEGIEDAGTLDTVAGALLNFASVASGVPADDINVSQEINLESSGLLTEESDADFETTWNRLQTAINDSPADIIFVVDHSANAEMAGLDLPPTRVVVFGNPVLGTPLMQVSATAGIDLPLKILVWQHEDDEIVYVTTNEIDFIESRHGIEGIDEAVNRIEAAIQNFMNVATGKQI